MFSLDFKNHLVCKVYPMAKVELTVNQRTSAFTSNKTITPTFHLCLFYLIIIIIIINSNIIILIKVNVTFNEDFYLAGEKGESCPGLRVPRPEQFQTDIKTRYYLQDSSYELPVRGANPMFCLAGYCLLLVLLYSMALLKECFAKAFPLCPNAATFCRLYDGM